uniref:NAD-dependent epimerase/dehydratase domain-containing protein n=2 Tax=Chenopodium quinoa TaxID=63459 RepID=A0A803LGW9_CHEQI
MEQEKPQIKGKVCVTGASGYLASWLVKRLLLSGYFVTGTVRDPGDKKKVEHLWRLDGAKERLKLVKADLTEDGSFDEAVRGCEGVFHTASPVSGSREQDAKAKILEPAIKGTLNVLRSCKKNPSLRRVVLTSSSSAVRVREDIDPNVPLDESVWSSTELCEQFQVWYALSKIEAEKAAWNFCKENHIDLVTILPAFIIGPSLPPNLCSTASDILGWFKGETSKFENSGSLGYVHIDDIALCHILVFEHQEAQGRYLCCSTFTEPYELASFLASQYPSYPISKGFTKLDRPDYTYNTSKIESLGFKFKPLEEMFDDTVKSLIMQGHL